MQIDPDGREIRIANDETKKHFEEYYKKVASKSDKDALKFEQQKDGSYKLQVTTGEKSSAFVKDLKELADMKDKTLTVTYLKDDQKVPELGKTSKEIQDKMGYAGITPIPAAKDANGDLVDRTPRVDSLSAYIFDMTNNTALPTKDLKDMKMGEAYLHEAVIHALPYFKGQDHRHGRGDVDSRTRKLRKEVEKNYDPKNISN